MFVPEKCSSVNCDLYHTNENRALRNQTAKLNKVLLDHIEAQSKIINDLTLQIQTTTNQVFQLTKIMQDQMHVISDID